MPDRQLTEAEALRLHESREWETWDARTVALFQLVQVNLCVPFSVFHRDVEQVLGRPVYVHEFVEPGALLREALGLGKGG